MRRKAILVLMGMLILSVAGLVTGIAGTQPQTAPDAGAQGALLTARSLYENGDYQLAARTYQQVVDQGYSDVSLYHNLGLAYYEAGELGQALWSLRSAQELAPRDSAVASALAQVRQQISLQGDESDAADGAPNMRSQGSGLAQGINLSLGRLTVNELALVAFVLWVLFAALLAVYWLDLLPSAAQSTTRAGRIIVSIALVAVVMALGSRVLNESRRDAVVVADHVEILAGPGEQYNGQVSLAAGAEVTILDQHENWTKLSAGENGMTGWAQTGTVRELEGRP